MKISKIGRRGLAVLIAVMFIGVAGAALLDYYGSIKTTATIEQSIVISDGTNWNDHTKPIEREFNGIAGDIHTFKVWIKNQAHIEGEVAIEETINWQEPPIDGITANHYIFGDTQTISLRHKTVVWGSAPWVIIEDGVFADVTFDTCGTDFDYTINYEGLDANMDYSLIYYADVDPRWEGTGIVTILGTFTTDTGDGTTSGTSTISTMPTTDDYNSYTRIEDDYEHRYGAKLWIIPSVATDGEKIINWYSQGGNHPFLWETDLALYIDCDETEPPCLEYVYPLFDTTTLQPRSEYCWITCYNFGIALVPGEYIFRTKLVPVL